jgi:hypothetical protein
MSSLTFKMSLTDSLDRFRARKRPFSSKRFRNDILSRALEMKIESFQDVRDELEDNNKVYAKLLVKGLLTYMGDHSNYPYTFYPEGVTKVENCFPDTDTWEVRITHSGERGDKETDAEIRIVRKGADAGDAVEAAMFDSLCYINRDVLYNNCGEAILEWEQHLRETDENEEEEEETKVFECESCPICFEKLEDKFIPQCGHPVCLECKENIDKCPTCRNPFKVMGYYYNDAKEMVENEIDECIAREDSEGLKKIVDLKEVAEQCLEDDGFCHSIGFEYEADWGYADGLEEESDYYWVLRVIN